MHNKVVVTGMGVLTPLGIGIDNLWKNLSLSKSGIRNLEEFDTSKLRSKICGAVWDYNFSDYFDKKEARRIDKFLQYAIVASREAISNSGIKNSPLDKERVGVAIGSGIGGIATIEKEAGKSFSQGPDKISPFFVPGTISNMASGYVSIENDFRGPSFSVVSACATGSHNIISASSLIETGQADVMICGGAEFSSIALGIGGFASMRALSTRNDDPEKASRPWDKNRDGFVLSDGAGVLVLESFEHASARGADIIAEVSGYGMSSDSFHITQPEPNGRGAYVCMSQALKKARLDPSSLGYINAHATSTPVGDQVEPKAIKSLLGEHAYNIPVSSTKSMLGHMLGAAGSVEAIISILALKNQAVPATINCVDPDIGCDLDFVCEGMRDHRFNHALSNSFGFGGTNASLLFSKKI